MDLATAQKLQSYIDAETSDSELYKKLAQMAPNENARQLILEFSDDEKEHADTFLKQYRRITGRKYTPKQPQINLTGTYKDILRDRVLDESGDYRKYGEQYITTTDEQLKKAYYAARTDENVHALRLLDLLSE